VNSLIFFPVAVGICSFGFGVYRSELSYSRRGGDKVRQFNFFDRGGGLLVLKLLD